MKTVSALIMLAIAALGSCSSAQTSGSDSSGSATKTESPAQTYEFNADSAYSYVARQVDFGPRVPDTSAHAACADWIEKELRRHGATVTLQDMHLTGFDGVAFKARNILGQFNLEKSDRILLIAHWDTRPWADEDPDTANRQMPVPGANDGASGVGVLLEIARQLGLHKLDKGIDILLVDAEDRGSKGDDESWALGAREFVSNPPIAGYRPAKVVLLDMVGGTGAKFHREQLSDYYATDLVNELWNTASASGYANRFVNAPGGAITDDHVEFIKAGIPAIDIIEYNEATGFSPHWHTVSDDMQNISRDTLKAVGQTVLNWLTN